MTLVPDADDQLTSDHGWDAIAHGKRLSVLTSQLKQGAIRTSLFIDPAPPQIEAAAKAGADRVELYTGPYADVFWNSLQTDIMNTYALAAPLCAGTRNGGHVGHDLSLQNLGAFLKGVPDVLEVSIGHAAVCESFDYGLEGTLDRYLAIVTQRG